MADCLIALGSNLGDRADALRQTFNALAELPGTRLIARSRLYQSTPIGGPADQDQFLNAAALLATSLSPARILSELQRIEAAAGRTPGERWGARPLDLDIALYGDLQERTPQLVLPHPRMAYRRFVLQPAAEIAPWMPHVESGWTIQRLIDHLDHSENAVAVAGESAQHVDRFIEQLQTRIPYMVETSPPLPTIRRWSSPPAPPAALPRLLLALAPSAGVSLPERRKMLQLPATGPVAWIDADPNLDPLDEAAAAIQAVWPPPCAGR
jgi:2-amino-4-hydroxy-6-hydroxymethyldihydropteridine diphosphokinase